MLRYGKSETAVSLIASTMILSPKGTMAKNYENNHIVLGLNISSAKSGKKAKKIRRMREEAEADLRSFTD